MFSIGKQTSGKKIEEREHQRDGSHGEEGGDEGHAGRSQSFNPYVHRWVDMAKEWLTLILNR